MSPPAVLEIEVQKRFADFALEAAFSVPPGITALFGPSGSGKTTVADLIAGIARPDAGRIAFGERIFFDREAGTDLPPSARRVGYVFQDNLLFPHMRVARNLGYGLPEGAPAGRLGEVAAALDIGHLMDRYPRALSGGEARRVAIGRALLSDPQILILDEPLSGVDPARREAFLTVLERLPRIAPVPVLYISHQLEEILRLADRAVLLAGGEVSAEGPLVEVLNSEAFRAFSGTYDTGVVLEARVGERIDGLRELVVAGVKLRTAQPDLAEGETVRVRILGRDVALALEPPGRTSVLNVLGCEIVEIEDEGGEALVALRLGAGSGAETVPLISRITRRSAGALGLAPGQKVYAMIKAVAINRGASARGAAIRPAPPRVPRPAARED